jgi:hypothetical protein
MERVAAIDWEVPHSIGKKARLSATGFSTLVVASRYFVVL